MFLKFLVEQHCFAISYEKQGRSWVLELKTFSATLSTFRLLYNAVIAACNQHRKSLVAKRSLTSKVGGNVFVRVNFRNMLFSVDPQPPLIQAVCIHCWMQGYKINDWKLKLIMDERTKTEWNYDRWNKLRYVTILCCAPIMAFVWDVSIKLYPNM